MLYVAHCMNIIFNSLLAQLVKYDVHTTCKIKSTRYFYHILFLSVARGQYSDGAYTLVQQTLMTITTHCSYKLKRNSYQFYCSHVI